MDAKIQRVPSLSATLDAKIRVRALIEDIHPDLHEL